MNSLVIIIPLILTKIKQAGHFHYPHFTTDTEARRVK